MVREQGRLLVQLVGVDHLQRLGQRLVDARAALAQLRVVGHLLRQRVLERVLLLGIEGDLVQELGLHQRGERSLELALVDLHDARQQTRGKLAVDHRGSLQHALLALRQAVDAGRQQHVDARRYVERLTGAKQAVGAPRVPDERARLDHRLHDLLGEEGVAQPCAS